jgi:hypothetical protein
MISVDRAWDDLFERFGDSLRAVTRFGPDGFETRMRPDVRAAYTDYEDQRVVDEVILDQLLSERIEEEFKCGHLTGTVHILEGAWVAVQTGTESRKSGYLATLDRDSDVALGDLEDCFDYFRSRAL